MIVADSPVWIDYFKGADTRETALLHADRDFDPMQRHLGLRTL